MRAAWGRKEKGVAGDEACDPQREDPDNRYRVDARTGARQGAGLTAIWLDVLYVPWLDEIRNVAPDTV